jgi:hypothetical protein
MNKAPLALDHLDVETFEPTPNLAAFNRVGGQGTACFETCANDPTSDPAVDTCGPAGCD